MWLNPIHTLDRTLAEQNETELGHARAARDKLVIELAHERQSSTLYQTHRELNHGSVEESTSDEVSTLPPGLLANSSELLSNIEGVLGVPKS